MGERHWRRTKDDNSPLFLRGPLLGGRLGRRRGGLGHTPRLGLADDLGLLNHGGSLDRSVSNGMQEVRWWLEGIQHTEVGVLRVLPELALGLAAAVFLVAVFLAAALGAAFAVVFLVGTFLAVVLGAAFCGGG